MNLESKTRFLFEAARFALRRLDLHIDTPHITVHALPENTYKDWAQEKDVLGYHRREAASSARRREEQQKGGIQEVGLCEITGPRSYTLTLSCPEVALEPATLPYWRAVVFSRAAHELAHVWDYENTARGILERDSRTAYVAAQDAVACVLSDLNDITSLSLPRQLKSYDAYEECIAQYTPTISKHIKTRLASRSDRDLAAIVAIQDLLIQLQKQSFALHSKGRVLTSERELQEGFAEYVKAHALEWFYDAFSVPSLDNAPPFAHCLQQLEVFKPEYLRPRMDKGVVTPIPNGPYTEGLLKFGQFSNHKEAVRFMLKAMQDTELPSY